MDQNYLQQCAATIAPSAPGRFIPPTDRQLLEEKKDLLTQELARVDAALKALDSHPELEEFTKVLQAALR